MNTKHGCREAACATIHVLECIECARKHAREIGQRVDRETRKSPEDPRREGSKSDDLSEVGRTNIGTECTERVMSAGNVGMG